MILPPFKAQDSDLRHVRTLANSNARGQTATGDGEVRNDGTK